MDLDAVLQTRNFLRFTGPPEHWLTAVKYLTWGLEDNLRNRWARIRPGDIFFIHSTHNSAFRNAKSGIIGLGVIGPDFSEKKHPLWFYETVNNVNRWPLLVPLSEIYLFSELPYPHTWENPSRENMKETAKLIDLLLKNHIPLKNIPGFPQMGSFSAVRSEVANRILYDKRSLYRYSSYEGLLTSRGRYGLDVKPSEMERQPYNVKNADEALRYADTLEIFDTVKARVIREPTSYYSRDNDILDRANLAHATILQQLIDLFKKYGYDTLSSRTVDLFTHNNERAFLLEVKSTENRNFRTQARKGIAQLFEYEYFDVRKFTTDNNLQFKKTNKLLIPSQYPDDSRYVEFINSLDIGVALVGEEKLDPVGKGLDFSKI